MPVMEFGRADEPADWFEWQPDIRMDVDGPNAPEGNESRESVQRKSKDERGQIDQTDGVNGVHGVLAVCGEPVEVFRAVMDGVKPPEKADPMLEAVAPVNQKIAQDDNLDGLSPPRLGGDRGAKAGRHPGVNPVPQME